MRAALARTAAVASLAVAVLAVPAAARAGDGRPWYVPDHATLQLAGDVGFLSPGVGWSLARKVEADVLFGWVPEAIGGTDIFALTGKVTLAPLLLGEHLWRVRPLTLGFQLTYTFGDQYYAIPDLEFPTPTALRAGLAIGADVRRRVGERTVGLYAELVALDLALGFWADNPDALGPTDVFTVALGVRLLF